MCRADEHTCVVDLPDSIQRCFSPPKTHDAYPTRGKQA